MGEARWWWLSSPWPGLCSGSLSGMQSKLVVGGVGQSNITTKLATLAKHIIIKAESGPSSAARLAQNLLTVILRQIEYPTNPEL